MERVVLITGGTGALGGAVAAAFLEAGDRVVVTYRKEREYASLRESAAERSEKLSGVTADVTDPAGVTSLVAGVVEAHGRVDVLALVAGGFAGGVPVAETSDDVWDRMISLNLTSAFICARAVMPGMLERGYGRIVTVASKGAVTPSPGAAAYAASKAGLIALTQALAAEGGARNVTANAVLPSVMDTPANRKAMPGADTSSWVMPGRVASVIAFLASPAADAVNGAAVPVYGARG
jgi:NAD(P)-dependent dehydrogenase (short-subunit alcohol dehydrogenase family)